MNTNMFCSFYVSEAHLVTMLLPYMKQKMEEEYDVYPFFEKDLNNIAHRIIDSITSVEEKTNLRKIEWKNNKIKLNKKRKKLIVIMGTEEYMKKKKKDLEEQLNNEDIVIECFEFCQTQEKIKEILDTHSKIINTKGEVLKEELFTQFTQKAENDNKEITIMK